VYANWLAFCSRAVMPSVLHETASSPVAPLGLPRLLASPVYMSVACCIPQSFVKVLRLGRVRAHGTLYQRHVVAMSSLYRLATVWLRLDIDNNMSVHDHRTPLPHEMALIKHRTRSWTFRTHCDPRHVNIVLSRTMRSSICSRCCST